MWSRAGRLAASSSRPEVSALFDQIIASIRRVDGAEAGAAQAAVAVPPGPVTFRYNQLDTTGAATAAGSFTFLKTAGDAASPIGDFGYFANGAVELRIHPTDASGSSRAAFYDTVQVGDSLDYQTNGPDCATRFRVTRVAPPAIPRAFGIEFVSNYGGWCAAFPDDPNAAKNVHFVWNPPAGSPAPDGVRLLLYGEPTGAGTYRLFSGLPYIIDVPDGMQVISEGYQISEPAADAPADASRGAVLLRDAATGSKLAIDPQTGRVTRRILKSPEVVALFDQIIASIRRG